MWLFSTAAAERGTVTDVERRLRAVRSSTTLDTEPRRTRKPMADQSDLRRSSCPRRRACFSAPPEAKRADQIDCVFA